MSFIEQWDALYALFYKEATRDAFLASDSGLPSGTGDAQRLALESLALTDAELAELQALSPNRLRSVVDLHANDLFNAWYANRFPATWLALEASLGAGRGELAKAFWQSHAFEVRVDDDSDGRALRAFVVQLRSCEQLTDIPWILDLHTYEHALGGLAEGLRVETFQWEVDAIRNSILEDGVVPEDEASSTLHLFFGRHDEGVDEVRLWPEQASVIVGLLKGADEVALGADAVADECLQLLESYGYERSSQR